MKRTLVLMKIQRKTWQVGRQRRRQKVRRMRMPLRNSRPQESPFLLPVMMRASATVDPDHPIVMMRMPQNDFDQSRQQLRGPSRYAQKRIGSDLDGQAQAPIANPDRSQLLQNRLPLLQNQMRQKGIEQPEGQQRHYHSVPQKKKKRKKILSMGYQVQDQDPQIVDPDPPPDQPPGQRLQRHRMIQMQQNVLNQRPQQPHQKQPRPHSAMKILDMGKNSFPIAENGQPSQHHHHSVRRKSISLEHLLQDVEQDQRRQRLNQNLMRMKDIALKNPRQLQHLNPSRMLMKDFVQQDVQLQPQRKQTMATYRLQLQLQPRAGDGPHPLGTDPLSIHLAIKEALANHLPLPHSLDPIGKSHQASMSAFLTVGQGPPIPVDIVVLEPVQAEEIPGKEITIPQLILELETNFTEQSRPLPTPTLFPPPKDGSDNTKIKTKAISPEIEYFLKGGKDKDMKGRRKDTRPFPLPKDL